MRLGPVAVMGALACALLAGCGSPPGDILGLGISGGPQKQAVRMHVTLDGRGSCNSGQLHELPSAQVLLARSIVREAKPLSKQAASFGSPTPDQRNFELRTPDGNVDWTEAARGLPPVLPQAEELALELQQELC